MNDALSGEPMLRDTDTRELLGSGLRSHRASLEYIVVFQLGRQRELSQAHEAIRDQRTTSNQRKYYQHMLCLLRN